MRRQRVFLRRAAGPSCSVLRTTSASSCSGMTKNVTSSTLALCRSLELLGGQRLVGLEQDLAGLRVDHVLGRDAARGRPRPSCPSMSTFSVWRRRGRGSRWSVTKPNARSSTVAGNFRFRSMWTYMTSLMSIVNSTHEPRYGMMRAENRRLAVRVRDLVEEHARRTVELADDHALGAVDDERALVGDQRQLAEVDLLLDHVLVAASSPSASSRDAQAQRGLERRREGQVALLALLRPSTWARRGRTSRTRARTGRAGPMIGKTLVKTSCSPSFFRSVGGTSICRKSRKDCSWTSSRFGISMSHSRSILL